MEKLLSLLSYLAKLKVIQTPRHFLYIVLCVALFYFPKYISEYIVYNVNNIISVEVKKALEEQEKENVNKHNKLIAYSMEISPQINDILREMQVTLDAHRTFFCEYSNSKVSLSGIPFLYFTMRNEQNASGVEGVKRQYQQQSIDNFRFNYDLFKYKIYTISNIEKIKESDPVFYQMLKKNGANKVFVYLIEIDNCPKGFVGITYAKEQPFSHDDVLYQLSRAGSKISHLLDYTKN